jgi:hypothetical protein
MDFMAKGGNISLFLSPNEEKFRYTNLEALLGEYNIVIHYDRIYETSSDMCKKDDPTTILFSLTAPDESQTVDLTTDLNSLVSSGIYPYITSSRSFGLVNGKNSAVLECNPLMQTAQGQSGYTSCSEPFGGTETDTESTSGLFNLACYSYNKSNNSKLVVFGNADFFDDENCGMGYTIIPITFHFHLFHGCMTVNTIWKFLIKTVHSIICILIQKQRQTRFLQSSLLLRSVLHYSELSSG